METEKELLQQIVDGDRNAMRRFYDRYAGYAMATSRRYIPDIDAAQDIVQDGFVKCFSSIKKFNYQGEGSLRGWFLRIIANAAIDYIKQQNQLVFTEEFPEKEDSQANEEPDVDNVPMEVINECIGKLPTGYRAVFNLYVFEKKSHKEIAQLLNIKENSSASQFSRAKQMLAKMINDYIKAH